MFTLGNFPGFAGIDFGPATIKLFALFVAVYQFIVLLAGVEGFVFSIAMRLYISAMIFFGALFTVLFGVLAAFSNLSGGGWIVVGVAVLLCSHYAAQYWMNRFWDDWAITVISMVFTVTAIPAHLWGYFFGYNPHGLKDYFFGQSLPFAWGVTIAGILLGVVVLKSIKWIYPYCALLYRTFVLAVACMTMLHPKLLGAIWNASMNGHGDWENRIRMVLDAVVQSAAAYGESVLWFCAGGLVAAALAAWTNRFIASSFCFFKALESAKEGFIRASIFCYLGWGIGAACSTLGRMLVLRRLPLGRRPLFMHIQEQRACSPAMLHELAATVEAVDGSREPA